MEHKATLEWFSTFEYLMELPVVASSGALNFSFFFGGASSSILIAARFCAAASAAGNTAADPLFIHQGKEADE